MKRTVFNLLLVACLSTLSVEKCLASVPSPSVPVDQASQALKEADQVAAPATLRGSPQPEQSPQTEQSPQPEKSKDLQSPEPQASQSSQPPHHLPYRVAAFASGFLVGTPVAVVRKTVKETAAGNRDIIEDHHNIFLVAPATVVSLPFGAVAGTFEGVYHSTINSWSKKPFSKDAFSLGPMEESK